jgi:hypothetical protein
MAEPWDTIRTVFTPAVALAACAAVWKLLFSGRIDDVHGERDRAIADRDRAYKLLDDEREKHEKTKAHWKQSVIAQREARRTEELVEHGTPSVRPLSLEEPTGSFFVDEAADQEWRRRSEERRMRDMRLPEAPRLPERVERNLDRYANTEDPLSTPPAPAPEKQRPKFPSRPR